MLVKSEWISQILPFPKNTKYLLHDYWTSIIVSQNGKIEYLKQPTIKYRQHTNNSVGIRTKSEELKKLEDIRKLFLDVKLEHFKIFVENENKFNSEKIKKLNSKSLKYFEKLETKKGIYLFNIRLFFKLYKYESFGYKIKNLIILHFPGIVCKIFNKIKENK